MSDGVDRTVAEHLAAACEIALAHRPASQSISPTDAHGWVLAEDAHTVLSVPPFTNSAMDGFLVHRTDLTGSGPWTLPVVADVPAGAAPHPPAPGQASRIMTGAPVGDPPYPDLVVIPVEHTTIPAGPVALPEEVTITTYREGRHNIRVAGENKKSGDLLVPAHTAVDAGTVASLVSAGVTEIRAHRPPRVAVIASGDELVPAGHTPKPGQIPDSNRHMLAALARANGAGQVIDLHAGDVGGGLAEALDEAAGQVDLMVTSGGVSAGAFDVVKATAAEKSSMWFGEVAQKPGAPQGLGTWEGTPLLCLPGNPVAAFVSFHMFVAPVMRVLAGYPVPEGIMARPRTRARAGHDMARPKDRMLVIPVRLDYDTTGEPTAIAYHETGVGSHMVASLSGTAGVALIAPGQTVSEGELVTVLLTRN